MPKIATALVDVLRRDGGEGEPAHATLGIARKRAAVLLAIAYERIHRSVTGKDAPRLPPEFEREMFVLPDCKP